MFGYFLDLALLNYEIELDLSWKKDCVPVVTLYINDNRITGATFQINNAKLDAPYVS